MAEKEKPVQVNAVAPGVNVDNMETLPFSVLDQYPDVSPIPMSQGVTPSPLGPVAVEETPPKVESLKRVLVQQFDSTYEDGSKAEIQASLPDPAVKGGTLPDDPPQALGGPPVGGETQPDAVGGGETQCPNLSEIAAAFGEALFQPQSGKPPVTLDRPASPSPVLEADATPIGSPEPSPAKCSSGSSSEAEDLGGGCGT